ncbi:transporter substrate-binding domain-containing protein [Ottowia testudinis]|uniref:Transporter substrate-binding domain-containing protein n=1 Tax=Ottowia testudinis TaxID=2816950 RepID=A0A975H7I7_9BURK|nr:transporter substrate-binding domain-containing protein [Ottowia testudinis]QTD47102.1 transporter substrate-binding domain-containing protein [Ottowia testudinis]
MIAKRPFLLSTVAAALCVASGMARADALQDIAKNGVVRVGVFMDYPPFGALGPDLKAQGYDIDLANLLAKELKVKPELVQITGDNRIPMLTSKKVDVLVSVGKSPEREKVIDFAQAYAPYYLAVFAGKGTAIKSSADLAGKTLAVARGTLEDTTISKEAPASATIRRFDEPNGAISAFVSGQAQALVVGNDVGATIMVKHPKLSMEQKYQLFSSPSHLAVNKGETALKNRLDEFLAKIKADGSLNALSVKWLKAPLPKDL